MSKQEELSLWLRLKDGVTAAIKDINTSVKSNLESMRQSAVLFAGAFAAITATIYASLKAFADQESATMALNQALANNGNYTKAAAQDLQNYATELARTTKYADEVTMAAMASFAAYGFEGEELKRLTRATMDLATAKGMDLKSAADLVAKSVGGSTNALARYGITVDGAAGSTERAEMAVRNISDLFGGQAASQANTFNGAVEQMKNAIGEVLEGIGEAFIPVLRDLAVIVKDAAEKFQQIYPNIKDLIVPITILAAGITGLMTLMAAVVTIGPMVGAAFTAMLGPVGLIITGISAVVAGFVYFKNSSSELAIRVRATFESLGEIFGNFGSLVKAALTLDVAGMKKALGEMRTALQSNYDAEKVAVEESRKLREGDRDFKQEAKISEQEEWLALDQEYLDRKAEMDAIAEEARIAFEEQKKIYDAMSAEQKVKLLSDTLGRESFLRTAAEIGELVSKGKHEEAKKKQNELYQDAFIKLNEKAIKSLDEGWRKHWDAQIAMAVFGNNMTKEQYSSMGKFFSDLMFLMGEKSIAAFRLTQAVAIGETIMSTYKAAQDAFAALAGIPVVGPVLGGIAAGVAVAAGIGRVEMIRRQEPPAMEVGGRVITGGLAELHPAEVILNKNQAAEYQAGGGVQHIYLQMNSVTMQEWINFQDRESERMGRMGIR